MSKDESKEKLKYSSNCLVKVSYMRRKNFYWDFTGIVRKVRKGSILIRLNDEETLSLGYRNMKHIKFMAGRNILKERYLMNKI